MNASDRSVLDFVRTISGVGLDEAVGAIQSSPLLEELEAKEKGRFAVAAFAAVFRGSRERGERLSFADLNSAGSRLFRTLFAEDADAVADCESALRRRIIEIELSDPDSGKSVTEMVAWFPSEKEFIEQLMNDAARISGSGRISGMRFHAGGEFGLSKDASITLSEEYTVVSPLGSGAQKNVYEVEQRSTGQHLVFKELRSENDSPSSRRAVTEEATIQAALSHQGVPIVYSLEANEEGKDLPKFVERFVRGAAWSEVVAEKTIDENIAILLQTARILAFAHREKNIAHCDVKPENVMLGEYGEIYLVDWGMAVDLNKTTTAAHMGTPAYSSPELANGSEIGLTVDVFALGAVLYKILAGGAPYENSFELNGLYAAVCDARECRCEPVPETAPARLRAIVAKAMAKDPKDRYRDAGEFADALEEYGKRSGLLRRYEDAEKAYEELERRFNTLEGDAKTKRGVRAGLTNELAGNVYELMQLSNAFAELTVGEETSPEDRETVARIALAELTARKFQIRQALDAGDFGQAEALNKVFSARSLILAGKPDAVAGSALTDARASEFQTLPGEFDREIARGLKERARMRRYRTAAIALVVVIALTAAAAMKIRMDAVEQEKKLVAEGYLKSISMSADLLKREKNWQSALALYGGGIEHAGILPRLQTLANLSARTALQTLKSSRFAPEVKSCAFSKDGKYFATLDGVSDFMLWNAETLETVAWVRNESGKEQEFTLTSNPLYAPAKVDSVRAVSPVILVSREGDYAWFDVKNRTFLWGNRLRFPKDVPNLKGSSAPAVSKKVRSGKANLYFGTSDGQVEVFSLPDGKFVRSFKALDSEVRKITLSDDESLVLVSGTEGELKLFAPSGKFLTDYDFHFPAKGDQTHGFFRPVAFSPNGRLAATGSEDGRVLVARAKDGHCIAEYANGNVPDDEKALVHRVSWLDDSRFVTVAADSRVKIWQVNEAKASLRKVSLLRPDRGFDEEAPGLRDLYFCQETNRLILCEQSHEMRLFDLTDGREIAHSEGVVPQRYHMLTICDSAYWRAHNQALLLTYSPRKSIVAYNADSLTVETNYCAYSFNEQTQEAGNLPCALALPEVGDEFAVSFANGDVFFFQKGKRDPVREMRKATPTFNEKGEFPTDPFVVATDPYGSFLAGSTFLSREIVFWNWKDGRELKRLRKAGKGDLVGLLFTDENTFLELCASGSVFRRDRKTGKVLASFLSSNAKRVVSCYALSHDRTQLAIGYSDGSVSICEVAKMTETRSFNDPCATQYDLFKRSLDATSHLGRKDQPFALNMSQTTGLAWSENDSLLAVTSVGGKSVVIALTEDYDDLDDAVSTAAAETDPNKEKENKNGGSAITSITVKTGAEPKKEKKNNSEGVELAAMTTGTDSANASVQNPPYINCFFTKDGALITASTDGALKKWDFVSAEEKATPLSTETFGKVVALKDGSCWIGLHDSKLSLHYSDPAVLRGPNGKNTWSGSPIKDACRRGRFGDIAAVNGDGSPVLLSESAGSRHGLFIGLETGVPKGGFAEIFASPDGKLLAALTTNRKTVMLNMGDGKGWRAVAGCRDPEKEGESNRSFHTAAFSPDSNKLAMLYNEGGRNDSMVSFYDIKEEVEHRPNLAAFSTGVESIDGGGHLVFVTNRCVVQSGTDVAMCVWDAEKYAIVQKLGTEPGVVLDARLFYEPGLVALNSGIGAEKRPAFAAGGSDGVLTFYALSNPSGDASDESPVFEPVWNISTTTLARIDGKLGREKKNNETWKQLSELGILNAFDDEEAEAETADDADDVIIEFDDPEDESEAESTSEPDDDPIEFDDSETDDEEDEDPIEFDDSEDEIEEESNSEPDDDSIEYDSNIVLDSPDPYREDDPNENPYFSVIRDLALSEDGRSLFVSSWDGVFRFDMAEIWPKIEGDIPQLTREEIERMTGLIYTDGVGLEPVLSNSLRRTEEKAGK